MTKAKKSASAEVEKNKQDEINQTLEKIFSSVSNAVNEVKIKERRVTLDQVNATLEALFDAVNNAHNKGTQAKIPDFANILNK